MTTTYPDTAKDRRERAMDEGRIPRSCPRWCEVDHLTAMQESELDQHLEHYLPGGEGNLPEMRNGGSRSVLRAGYQHYSLEARQVAFPGGGAGMDLIQLFTASRFGLSWDDGPNGGTAKLAGCTILLTTGEARTLSAHLLDLADALDLRP